MLGPGALDVDKTQSRTLKCFSTPRDCWTKKTFGRKTQLESDRWEDRTEKSEMRRRRYSDCNGQKSTEGYAVGGLGIKVVRP